MQAYLVGVEGLEDVTGHLGLRVVRLAAQQVRKVGEVIAVVYEARDELRLVFEDENGRAVAAGRDAADERRVEQQLNFSGLHDGAEAALLAPPADLGHQPRQHGQGGSPVQRAPAHVRQRERLPRCFVAGLHVGQADFYPKTGWTTIGTLFHEALGCAFVVNFPCGHPQRSDMCMGSP